MTTIDLSTPQPQSVGLLDSLPRRAALTLVELRLLAERAGGAPLPFDLVTSSGTPDLDDRLGQSRGTTEDQAYEAALGSLHDAATSLTRRGLIVDDVVDDGLLGAVGLLATPSVAVDIDVVAEEVQAKSWHRQSGDAVATLSTTDGIVFELAWFPTAAWPAELARIPVIPEDIVPRESLVPALVDLPYELADAAAEAVRTSRPDLLLVLATQHSGKVTDAEGKPYSEAEASQALGAMTAETQGRLRVMIADVSTEPTTVVGVLSWVLLADGWHTLRPHHVDGALRVEVRRVDAADLAPELAPLLAEVTA